MKKKTLSWRDEVRTFVIMAPDSPVKKIAESVGCCRSTAGRIRAEMEREGEVAPMGRGAICRGVWVLPPTIVEINVRQATQNELSGLRNRVRELEGQLAELRAVVSPELPPPRWGSHQSHLTLNPRTVLRQRRA